LRCAAGQGRLPIRTRPHAFHPLIVGGGHGTFHPEPISDFFDVFVSGTEEALPASWRRGSDPICRVRSPRALLPIAGLFVSALLPPALHRRRALPR
jgi:hypothetical protein